MNTQDMLKKLLNAVDEACNANGMSLAVIHDGANFDAVVIRDSDEAEIINISVSATAEQETR